MRFEKDELDSNIGQLKQKLYSKSTKTNNGKRFTIIKPEKQQILFLGCPLENDEALLKDFYEISDELFFTAKQYADGVENTLTYLLTEEKRLAKKKLKPLILF